MPIGCRPSAIASAISLRMPALSRDRIVEGPFEVLRPLARGHQDHELAQRRAHRGVEAQVVAHRARERHHLRAVHQRLEGAEHRPLARRLEVGRGLLLLGRILRGRNGRQAILGMGERPERERQCASEKDRTGIHRHRGLLGFLTTRESTVRTKHRRPPLPSRATTRIGTTPHGRECIQGTARRRLAADRLVARARERVHRRDRRHRRLRLAADRRRARAQRRAFDPRAACRRWPPIPRIRSCGWSKAMRR